MINVIFWVYVFLDILTILIFIDVVLSWILVFWINLRPKFLQDIVWPLYAFVKKIIPTNIWPLDFTPIVIFFIIWLLKMLLMGFFPEIWWLLNLYKWMI